MAEVHTTFMGKMATALHTIAESPSSTAGYVFKLAAGGALSGFVRQDDLSSEESLRRMMDASNEFYGMATSTGCHAFIEFAGLMNEFIKVCQEAEKQRIDWRNANTHTKKALPFKPYHIAYLNDKLECIFQGLSFAAQEDER